MYTTGLTVPKRSEISVQPEEFPNVFLAENGIDFAVQIDRSTWVKLGKWLGGVNTKSKIWLADWAAENDRRHWEYTDHDLAEITGLDVETVQNYRYVGRRVRKENRADGLPVSHYQAVAPLSDSEQTTLLKRDKQEGWDRETLRDAVRQVKEGTLPEHITPLMASESYAESHARVTAAGETVDMETGEIISSGRQKQKTNRAGDPNESKGYDRCQTPPHAVTPLLPYLTDMLIWEPAKGEGLLVEALGGDVIATDILDGPKFNFFDYEPPEWDCVVTNPPFSIKYTWLARCYALGKPFALLMPVETLGAASGQVLFKQHGIQMLFLNQRINFKMPVLGWEGDGAKFPVAWFTWGLDLPSDMVFAEVGEIDPRYAKRG